MQPSRYLPVTFCRLDSLILSVIGQRLERGPRRKHVKLSQNLPSAVSSRVHGRVIAALRDSSVQQAPTATARSVPAMTRSPQWRMCSTASGGPWTVSGAPIAPR